MEKVYGIDLGTTNSLIGIGGEILGSMVPSIVSLEYREAGKKYKEDYTAVRSFKVDISLGTEGKESIVASSMVLKTLVEQAKEHGHNVKKVIISVPAYFSDNQRQATIRAAELINLEVVGLINEPTAAAIQYSKNSNSLTLVYDLGGGTFDVSVIDSRYGNFDVQSTDGLILGGDDLDRALMKFFLKDGQFKMHRMKPEDTIRLKELCESTKIKIQKEMIDQFVDIREFSHCANIDAVYLPTEKYAEIVKLVFGPTIIKTKQIISETIMFGESYKFLLVGGSTRDPYLQSLIEMEIGKEPEPIDYNPDMIVAEGACYYAHLVETGEAEIMVSDVTKALSIGLRDGTVSVLIPKNSKLPISESKMVTNYSDADGLELELYQGDSILASNNEFIGKMLYKFDETRASNSANVKVTIEVSSNGTINLKAKEMLKKEVSISIDRSGV